MKAKGEVDEGGEVMAEPSDDVISHAGIPLQMLGADE